MIRSHILQAISIGVNVGRRCELNEKGRKMAKKWCGRLADIEFFGHRHEVA